MGRVEIFVSNPGHHSAMLAPVARRLAEAGVERRVLSLAELRGLPSPSAEFAPSTRVESLTPPWFRRRRAGASSAGSVESPWTRRVLRDLLWRLVLEPRLARLLDAGTSLAVLPNDSAFPYDRVANLLAAREVPYVLVQEGIRFPLPSERASRYGLGGARALAVWGEGSAAHFAAIGVERRRLHVTGNPRFDDRREPVPCPSTPVLALLTNPIDAQGFCSRREKLELAADFVRCSEPPAGARLVLRTHPGESSADYLAAMDPAVRPQVEVDGGGPLEPLLDGASAVVVMASTVGLEALRLGRTLGVLPIPGHGYVHDYVSSRAASGLVLDAGLPRQVAHLLAPPPEAQTRSRDYVAYHLAHQGEAALRVAGLIIAQLES